MANHPQAEAEAAKVLDQLQESIRRSNAAAERFRSDLTAALEGFLGADPAVRSKGLKIAEAQELFALVLNEYLHQLGASDRELEV